tara:strand:- start:392 stop:1618 length:1227 start_codon:yes stop_codon:yes gene_type:complete
MSNKSHSNHLIGNNFLLSLETRGIKLGLERTQKLLSLCGNPEKNIQSVQIIGTNGKGTTAASLSSILQSAGLKVGLYTSPHLVSLNERIQINNSCIPNSYINAFIKKYKNNILMTESTFFESLTVLALDFFSYHNIDIAILETGLGGEHDSVTASDPCLQLFTSIAKDHMHILGDNIEAIAKTKGNAIHNSTPCISRSQEKSVQSILDDIAKQRNTFIDYDLGPFNSDYKSHLIGEHQKDNILLAVKASQFLYPSITKSQIINGIQNTIWPGRMQIIDSDPLVIFDVAHNEQGLLAFCNSIEELSIKGQKTLMISLQKTKVINNAIPALCNVFDKIICTQLNDRMYTNIDLQNMFSLYQNIYSTSNPHKFIKKIIKESNKEGLIAIIGSHYWGEQIEKIFKISLVSTT